MTKHPLFSLGFRAFFAAGVAHAAIAIGLWVAILRGVVAPPLAGLAPVSWHAHELLFGFTRAIVAGFLLTAVRSWTQRPTPTGGALAGLLALWAVPRVLITVGSAALLPVVALLDIAFGAALLVSVARPVIEARQPRNAGVIAKVLLLTAADATFYAGALGGLPDGVAWGTWTAVYLVVALVLTILRRVLSFFVTSALPGVVALPERAWLDRASLVSLAVLFVLDVFTAREAWVAVAAGAVATVHLVRLATWWRRPVLGRPLLWVLYAAYAWIVVGFALRAASPWLGLPVSLPLHAVTVGGLGTVIAGMVARVSLGHTGRDVRAPRPGLALAFGALSVAATVRVFVPAALPGVSLTAWSVAGALWVAAFGGLWVWGLPLWTRPRPDGAG